LKVGDLFKIIKGCKVETTFADYDKGLIRFIQIEDLRSDTKLKYTTLEKGYVACNKDDYIIAWDGANAGTIGFNLEGVIGSTLAILRKKSDVLLNADYVGRFLQSKSAYLRSQCNGATIPHIQKSVLEEIKIPLPDIETQNRIASLFNEAGSLIQKRKESIAKLDELVKSYFIFNVGPKNPDYTSWKKLSINELALQEKGSMRTGPFGSDLKHSEFVDEGIAVLGIDNAVKNIFSWGERRFITEEKYEKLKRYTVKPGDVIITIMGTTGRSAVVPEDIPLAITTKHLATITVNKDALFPEYLSYCIHSHPDILQQIKLANKGAIMDGLNLGIIKGLQIKVPPIEQQRKFMEIYHEIQSQRLLMQQQLLKLEENFQSLLHQAFTGRLQFRESKVDDYAVKR
jgi:type I restriction enzyme S subunit